MNKVLYVSLADWYWIKQRPHHFCESMSKLNYDVDYLCKKPCRKVGRCMENADKDVKDKTTFICGSNVVNGVSDFIQKYINPGWR